MSNIGSPSELSKLHQQRQYTYPRVPLTLLPPFHVCSSYSARCDPEKPFSHLPNHPFTPPELSSNHPPGLTKTCCKRQEPSLSYLRHKMSGTHQVVSTKVRNERSPETLCGWAHLSAGSVHTMSLLHFEDLFKCSPSIALCILSFSNDYPFINSGNPRQTVFPVPGPQPKWKLSTVYIVPTGL